jgi:hypothetical protein
MLISLMSFVLGYIISFILGLVSFVLSYVDRRSVKTLVTIKKRVVKEQVITINIII